MILLVGRAFCLTLLPMEWMVVVVEVLVRVLTMGVLEWATQNWESVPGVPGTGLQHPEGRTSYLSPFSPGDKMYR